MALEYAHGAIQWLAADAATTTYTVSGLSFQPKALRFYWVGLANAADAVSEAVNERRGVGFAVSTSSRRAIGTFSQDTAATSNCGAAARDDCCVCTTDGAGASDGRLDLDLIAADGFRMIVDDQAPANITVFWEAWGGSDITVAAVGDIAEPAGTGDQDYTVTGFLSGATDQVVMLAGCQSTAALNTDAAADSGLHVGFATAAAGVTVCGNSDDASGTLDTDGYCQDGECLSMIVLAGGNPDARATLTQWNADGFRLNWAARATTNRRSCFLAIKGGSWAVGAYTIAGNSGSATATVSGLLFAPKGISLVGRMTAENTAATATANDIIGFGSGSSTSSRRSMGVLDENATASSVCEINATIQYDQVLSFPSTAGALQSAYDIDAMNSDGFRIIVDTAGGVASEWQGYMAFGDAPVFGGDDSDAWWSGGVGKSGAVLAATLATVAAGFSARVALNQPYQQDFPQPIVTAGGGSPRRVMPPQASVRFFSLGDQLPITAAPTVLDEATGAVLFFAQTYGQTQIPAWFYGAANDVPVTPALPEGGGAGAPVMVQPQPAVVRYLISGDELPTALAPTFIDEETPAPTPRPVRESLRPFTLHDDGIAGDLRVGPPVEDFPPPLPRPVEWTFTRALAFAGASDEVPGLAAPVEGGGAGPAASVQPPAGSIRYLVAGDDLPTPPVVGSVVDEETPAPIARIQPQSVRLFTLYDDGLPGDLRVGPPEETEAPPLPRQAEPRAPLVVLDSGEWVPPPAVGGFAGDEPAQPRLQRGAPGFVRFDQSGGTGTPPPPVPIIDEQHAVDWLPNLRTWDQQIIAPWDWGGATDEVVSAPTALPVDEVYPVSWLPRRVTPLKPYTPPINDSDQPLLKVGPPVEDYPPPLPRPTIYTTRGFTAGDAGEIQFAPTFTNVQEDYDVRLWLPRPDLQLRPIRAHCDDSDQPPGLVGPPVEEYDVKLWLPRPDRQVRIIRPTLDDSDTAGLFATLAAEDYDVRLWLPRAVVFLPPPRVWTDDSDQPPGLVGPPEETEAPPLPRPDPGRLRPPKPWGFLPEFNERIFAPVALYFRDESGPRYVFIDESGAAYMFSDESGTPE